MRRLHLHPFLLIALILASAGLGGCEAPDASGPTVEERDSAGVTIVENSGEVGPDGGGWWVDPDPFLSVGTFQGDSVYQLYQVQGATRLRDGRIVVANAGSGEVRVFDEDGRFLASHGRKGEGPGEFQRPALAGVLGSDTLIVVDADLRRISLLQPEPGFLESVRLSDDAGGGGFPQGVFADGKVVLGGGFFWSSDSGVELGSGYSRRSTSYVILGLDGEVVTDLGEFPGSEFFMEVQNHGGGAVSMRARLIPFGKYAMQAVGPRRFHYASGDAWEIHSFDSSGALQRIVRHSRAPSAVQAQDLEARIQEEIAELSDPSEAPEVRASFDEMPVPGVMPAMAGLQADARGCLWVESYPRPGDETAHFDVLDPGGRLVGSVSLPSGLEVLEIGDDYVLTLYRDELEVEYLRLHRLERPPEGPAG
jgi:hypothetical protein